MLKDNLLYIFFILYSMKFYSSKFPSCDDAISIVGGEYNCAKESKNKINEDDKTISYMLENNKTNSKRLLKISIKEENQLYDSSQYRIPEKLKKSRFIIKRVDIIEEDGFIFEIFEYPSGDILFNYLTKLNYRADQKTILKIFYGIVKGVKEMHDNNITRVNIKLDNILLNENGNPKMIDLSCALIENKNMPLEGSLQYAAPELLKPNENGFVIYDEKTDIWALGVTLYYMLYRNYPFFVSIWYGRLILPDYEAIKFHKGTTYELVNLILMMLKPNPRNRADIDTIIKTITQLSKKSNWKSLKKNQKIKSNIKNVYKVDFNSKEETIEEQKTKIEIPKIEENSDIIEEDKEVSSSLNTEVILLLGGIISVILLSIVLSCTCHKKKQISDEETKQSA